MTQILIVGAGPVGLTMAAELARYGIELRIIDPHATEASKALALWSRTLELMDRATETRFAWAYGLNATTVLKIRCETSPCGHVLWSRSVHG
jgi:2-polyprenyl-6-methoxyphenol hydroxylase-like FAD-dependent oxidoreductase